MAFSVLTRGYFSVKPGSRKKSMDLAVRGDSGSRFGHGSGSRFVSTGCSVLTRDSSRGNFVRSMFDHSILGQSLTTGSRLDFVRLCHGGNSRYLPRICTLAFVRFFVRTCVLPNKDCSVNV